MNKNMLALLCLAVLAAIPGCWCCKPKCKKQRDCETRIVYKPECETRCQTVTEMVPQCVDEVVTETVMVPQCRDKVIKKTVMVPQCKEVCHQVEVMVPHEQKIYTTTETTDCKPCKPKCQKTCKPRCRPACKKRCEKPCAKKRCCGTSSSSQYSSTSGVVDYGYDNNGYTGGVVGGSMNAADSAVGMGTGVVRDVL